MMDIRVLLSMFHRSVGVALSAAMLMLYTGNISSLLPFESASWGQGESEGQRLPGEEKSTAKEIPPWGQSGGIALRQQQIRRGSAIFPSKSAGAAGRRSTILLSTASLRGDTQAMPLRC